MAEGSITINMSLKNKQRLANYISEHAMDIIMEVGSRTAPKGYDYISSVCKSAVDTFYKEYPAKYNRKHDLHNAYDVGIRDGWDLFVSFGSDLMKYSHHQSNEFIYVNSFEKGYHGGSFGVDKFGDIAAVPYWRTPPGMFTHWYPAGFPAPRSVSPYKTITNKIGIYDRNVYTPMWLKEYTSVLSQIRKRLGV